MCLFQRNSIEDGETAVRNPLLLVTSTDDYANQMSQTFIISESKFVK